MDASRLPPPGSTTLPLKPAFQEPFDLKHDDFDLKINISPEYLISKFIAGCQHGVMKSPSGKKKIPITFRSMQANVDIHVSNVNTAKIEEDALGFLMTMLNISPPPSVETVLSNELLAFIRQKLAKTFTKLDISLEINEQLTDQEIAFIFAQLQRKIVGILFSKMTGIFADNQKVANACFRENGLKKLEAVYPKTNWKPFFNPPHNDYSHKFLRILINRLGLQNVTHKNEEDVDILKFNLQDGKYFNFFISVIHKRTIREPLPEMQQNRRPSLKPLSEAQKSFFSNLVNSTTLATEEPTAVLATAAKPLPLRELSVVSVNEVKPAVNTIIEPIKPQEPKDPLLETNETLILLKNNELMSDSKLLEIIRLLKDMNNVFISTWVLVFEKARGRHDIEIKKELWLILKSRFLYNLHRLNEKDAKIVKGFWSTLLQTLEFQKNSSENLKEKQDVFIDLITKNPDLYRKIEIIAIFVEFKTSWKKCLDSQKSHPDVALYTRCFTEWFDKVLSVHLDIDNVVYIGIEHLYTLLHYQDMNEIKIYTQKLESSLKLHTSEEKQGYITIGQLHMDTLLKQFPKKILTCQEKIDEENHHLLSQLTLLFIDINIKFKCRSLSGLSGVSFLWSNGDLGSYSQVLKLLEKLANESLEGKDIEVLKEIQLEKIIFDISKDLSEKIKKLQTANANDSKEQEELLAIGRFLVSINFEYFIDSRQFLDIFLEIYHTFKKDVRDHAKIKVLLDLCLRLNKSPAHDKFQELIKYYILMTYMYTLHTGDLVFFKNHLDVMATVTSSLKFDKLGSNDEEIKAPLFLLFFFHMQTLVAKTKSFETNLNIIAMSDILHSKLKYLLDNDLQLIHDHSEKLTRWLVILLSRTEPEFKTTITSFRQCLSKDKDTPVKWILNLNWDIVEALFTNTLTGYFDSMLRDYFSTRPMKTRSEFRNTVLTLYHLHVILGLPLVEKLEKLVESSLPYLCKIINQPTIQSFIIYLDPHLYKDKGDEEYPRLKAKLEKSFAIIATSTANTMLKAVLMSQVIKSSHTMEYQFSAPLMLELCMYVFEEVRKLNWSETIVKDGIISHFRNHLKDQKWENPYAAFVAEFAFSEGDKIFEGTEGDLKLKQKILINFLKGDKLALRIFDNDKIKENFSPEQLLPAVKEYVDKVSTDVIFNLDIEKYKAETYTHDGIDIINHPIGIVQQFLYSLLNIQNSDRSHYENLLIKLRRILIPYVNVIAYLPLEVRLNHLNLYINILTIFYQMRKSTPKREEDKGSDVQYIKDLVDLVVDLANKPAIKDPGILLGTLYQGIQSATKPTDAYHKSLLLYLENYAIFKKLTINKTQPQSPHPFMFHSVVIIDKNKLLLGKK